MGNKVVTTVRDNLLHQLDGMTCDELITFFNEIKEDYGDNIVLDYYHDNDNDDRIELRLISVREETPEEEIAAKRKQLESAIKEKKERRLQVERGLHDHNSSLSRLDADITEMENRLKELQNEHSQTNPGQDP